MGLSKSKLGFTPPVRSLLVIWISKYINSNVTRIFSLGVAGYDLDRTVSLLSLWLLT